MWQSRTGVCRDFAHLGLTLCRSLNIPARYVFGYLPDVDVPAPDEPMDFCAWFEAYLEDRWWTFDPRNNVPRTGRVVIGRGRDALDVAMVTTYGAPVLQHDDGVGRPGRRSIDLRRDEALSPGRQTHCLHISRSAAKGHPPACRRSGSHRVVIRVPPSCVASTTIPRRLSADLTDADGVGAEFVAAKHREGGRPPRRGAGEL